MEELNINTSDKERIISFIKENDLDYKVVDNGITRFHVVAEDGMKFQFQNHNENWILIKYDPRKDEQKQVPFDYFNYKTLPQVLEQLSYHDKSITKTYWDIILDSIQIGFDKENYNENWFDGIINEDWEVEDCGSYKTISYVNDSYKPELKSPFNTLHEVSTINDIQFTKVEKLSIEIHPISCLEGNESYLLKLLCNNEEVFKEYINYRVYKKKGIKMLLEQIFSEMERFKS